MTQDQFWREVLQDMEDIRAMVTPPVSARPIKARCSNQACGYKCERERTNTHPCPYCRREMIEES